MNHAELKYRMNDLSKKLEYGVGRPTLYFKKNELSVKAFIPKLFVIVVKGEY